MEQKKTLREILDIYIEKRRSEGKIITKDSYQPLKSIVYFIENKKGTPYLTQSLFKEWRDNRIRPYGAMTVVHAFLVYAREQGYMNIRCPMPKYVGIPKRRLFDMPLEKSIVSEMMTKFFNWRKKSMPLNSNYHYTLIRFNNFCRDNYPDAQRLTQDMIESWAEKNDNESSKTRNRRLAPIALFIEYAQGHGWTGIQRPASLPEKKRVGRCEGHIFTSDEMERFFCLTNNLEKHAHETVRVYNRKRLVLSVLFRLLYSTGMRVLDVLRLKRDDVDLETGIITYDAYNNKNRKTKLALTESMHELMRKYDTAMDKVIPNRNAFFPNDWNGHLTSSAIVKHFRQLWAQVSDCKACLSDFRVTFAVEIIRSWEYDGTDWTIDMVNLSKAMGLCNTKVLQKYLTLVPRYQKKLSKLTGKNIEKLLPDINIYEEENK